MGELDYLRVDTSSAPRTPNPSPEDGGVAPRQFEAFEKVLHQSMNLRDVHRGLGVDSIEAESIKEVH